MEQGGQIMYYAIMTKDAKVHDVECAPRDIDDRIEKLDGFLITQAETLERYREKRAQDHGGEFTWE